MSWQPIAEIQLTSYWQLTEPITGSAFRLKHTITTNSPQNLRAVVAQVYDEDNLLTYFNDKVVTFRTESQGFIFPQIAGILNRKFALKRLDNLADDWTITIEVLDGMPESISLPIAVSEVTGLEEELASKAASESLNIHVADTNNPHAVTAEQVGAEPLGGVYTALALHEQAENPHAQYATDSDVNTIAAALTAKEQAGTAVNAIASHVAEPDPHSQYATDVQIGQLQTAVNGKEAIGVAANLVTQHEATVNHPLATTTAKGMMSNEDKSILNKLNNYPVLNVLKNSQSITVATDVLLTFSTIINDSHNAWNATSNQWTCPQTGTYLIGAVIEMLNNTAANGEGRIKIYKNNTQIHRLDQRINIPASSPVGVHGFLILNLVIGDLVDIRFISMYATSSAPITISAATTNFQYSFLVQRIK